MADFTMGLDAELAFFSPRGEFVYANQYVNGLHNKFGVDGCSAIAEIRPTPAQCPVELVNNVRKAMQYRLNRTARLKDILWKAGGYQGTQPLGAHIHFGAPIFQGHSGAPARQAMGKLMDALVLPLATALESPLQAKQRRSRYGYPSDVREQPHGMEYRSCSSFIASPATAVFILTVAWAVAHDHMDGVLGKWAPFAFERDAFMAAPVKVSLVNMDKRLEFLSKLTKLREGLYKEIFDGGAMLLGKAKFEQVEDMKKAWKLDYEPTPEPSRAMTPQAAWEYAGQRRPA